MRPRFAAQLTGALPTSDVLWIHSMGKRFQVLGMWPDTDEGTVAVNQYCASHRDGAVIATMGGVIFVANKYAGLHGYGLE